MGKVFKAVRWVRSLKDRVGIKINNIKRHTLNVILYDKAQLKNIALA